MTSEICLMNRHAIVLAADSATTVTRWNEGRREDRYFKGANKVFQLSTHHPIGLMINDSASILRVPWEVVIKEFRRHLGETSFSGVRGYAEAFFQYLNEAKVIFPPEVQDEFFVSGAYTAGLNQVISALQGNDPDSEDAKRGVEELFVALQTEAASVTPHPSLRDVDLEAFLTRASALLLTRYSELPSELSHLPLPSDMKAFADSIVKIVVSEPSKHLGTTGLVFAGYGNDDIFPSMTEYQSCGIISSTHLPTEIKTTSISHSIPAAISGFAQTSMIETFQMGVSREVYVDLADSINGGLEVLLEETKGALGSAKAIKNYIEKADLPAVFDRAAHNIKSEILDRAFAQNVAPLRNVLSSLPVEEMSELAESLINLQSLKEKVTKPSETVGGPVDVAAITKAEGLVWMKRKHYFDRELNSRFALRQTREHR